MHDNMKVTRCAIYTRVDPGEDNGDEQLQLQLEAAHQFIERHAADGWVLLEERFDDICHSATQQFRPALARLCQAVKDGRLECIVVTWEDRLAPSLIQACWLINFLDRHWVQLIAVWDDQYDPGKAGINLSEEYAKLMEWKD